MSHQSDKGFCKLPIKRPLAKVDHVLCTFHLDLRTAFLDFLRRWRMIIAVNFQFKKLERRSLKNSWLQRDSNPWPPWYRCDALPTELRSHALEARSNYWVHISREEWNDVKYIWNNSYLTCAGLLTKVENDLLSKFPIQAIGTKPEKNHSNSNPWPPRSRYRWDALPTRYRTRVSQQRTRYTCVDENVRRTSDHSNI